MAVSNAMGGGDDHPSIPVEAMTLATRYPQVAYLLDHLPFTELSLLEDTVTAFPAGIDLQHPCDSI